jgi:hypothetical protein
MHEHNSVLAIVRFRNPLPQVFGERLEYTPKVRVELIFDTKHELFALRFPYSPVEDAATQRFANFDLSIYFARNMS